MRSVLILLLLANVGYFAWQNYFKPDVAVLPAKTVQVTSNNLPALVLLSEARQKPAMAQGEPPEFSGAAAGTLLLGGFVERSRIEELRQRLLSLGVGGEIVERQQATEEEYWVYMPPLSSRAATLRLLKELQARRLDGFLITQGELANGISLGIFPHENSADAILERLQIAGYQAKIKRIARAQSVYWFQVARDGQGLVDERMLRALSNDFQGMQHAQMPE